MLLLQAFPVFATINAGIRGQAHCLRAGSECSQAGSRDGSGPEER